MHELFLLSRIAEIDNVFKLLMFDGANILHRQRGGSFFGVVVRGERAVSGIEQEDCE